MRAAKKPAPECRTEPAECRWLRTGNDAFAAMLNAIRDARQSIRLETYIFRDSTLGQSFRTALAEAAQRGVKVKLLLDAFGCISLPQSYWDPVMQAGGEVRWFNPLVLKRLAYRDHRKLLVVDDQLVFVGGFNIAPEYEGDGVTSGWCDLALGIVGAPVVELAKSFDLMFERADFRHRRWQRFRRARNVLKVGGDSWRLLLSGPGWGHVGLKRPLADDLRRARSVRIMAAYFLPTWRIRRELTRVARRGGRVQLILAGKSDVKLSQLASRRLYTRLLRSGVSIYEYQPQILHAKLLVVDNFVYAGSANLDMRSLRINYELMVRILQPSLAEEARSIFEAALQHCRQIELKAWRASRGFWQKLLERWAYFLLARVDPYLARQQLQAPEQ